MEKITRKIIGQDYSRLVCLPKAWLQWNNLDAGEIVEFEFGDDKSLTIRAKKVKKDEKEE